MGSFSCFPMSRCRLHLSKQNTSLACLSQSMAHGDPQCPPVLSGGDVSSDHTGQVLVNFPSMYSLFFSLVINTKSGGILKTMWVYYYSSSKSPLRFCGHWWFPPKNTYADACKRTVLHLLPPFLISWHTAFFYKQEPSLLPIRLFLYLLVFCLGSWISNFPRFGQCEHIQ